MNNEKLINEKIINLWDEYFTNDPLTLHPLFFPILKRDCILFVGCNPSFNEKGFKSILRNSVHTNLDFNTLYLWKNKNEETIELTTQLANEAKIKHSYFQKFSELSNDTNLEWEHVDLFFVHETTQENIKAQILNKNSKLNEFGKRQIEISKEVISLIEPRIIVVANAFASGIFQQEFNCIFNETFGCHFVRINEKKTPVFFTSMLTGQRALDRGSFVRLKWHIKKIADEF